MGHVLEVEQLVIELQGSSSCSNRPACSAGGAPVSHRSTPCCWRRRKCLAFRWRTRLRRGGPGGKHRLFLFLRVRNQMEVSGRRSCGRVIAIDPSATRKSMLTRVLPVVFGPAGAVNILLGEEAGAAGPRLDLPAFLAKDAVISSMLRRLSIAYWIRSRDFSDAEDLHRRLRSSSVVTSTKGIQILREMPWP